MVSLGSEPGQIDSFSGADIFFFSCLCQQFIDLVQGSTFLIVVETVIADHREIVIWDMYEEPLDEITAGFFHIDTHIVLMTVIEPVDRA